MAKKHFSTGNKRRKKSFFKSKWFLVFLFFFVLIFVLGVIAFQMGTREFRERAETYDLSKIDDVEVKSLILDRHGRELGRIFVENRDKISIKDVPEIMIYALVSGEDQRFFEHDGVDRIGVIRAAYLNLKAGRQTQGASTITQQLARNAFHLKEDSDKRGEGGLQRKAVEAFLAMRIEKKYTKYEILEFYFNRIPFGSGFYGIRSASLGYFGKEPRDLTVSECASLVACIRNPRRISPLNSVEENKKNRDQVLGRMADEGYILRSVCDELRKKPVVTNSKPIRRGSSHLYDKIAGLVRGRLGEDAMTEGGYKIYTTIDLDVQKEMERSLRHQLSSVESREGYAHSLYKDYKGGRPKYLQGAGMMVENDTGALIAYVGGRDFNHSQYDFIKLGRKPLGTAFLPMIYMAALEQKSSLADMLLDKPMDNRAVMLDGREGVLGEWGAESLTPVYEGDVSLRHAMAVSKIGASIRLGKELGLANVAKVARRFGFSVSKDKLLARMLVGTDDVSLSELVSAYAVFPNRGMGSLPVYAISKIEDSAGKTRYIAKKPKLPKRVVSAENAFLMHTLLQSSLKKGTGEKGISDLNNDPSVAGKTGTTYDFSNNWFVGYNSRVTCAVWAGFLGGSRDSIYPAAFSRETVLPVWISSMNAASREFLGGLISPPEKIVKVDICKDSGRRKTRYCQDYIRDVRSGEESYVSTAYTEYFLKGQEPSGFCDVHGVSDPALAEYNNLHLDKLPDFSVVAIPIQPQAPVLLGNDPYGTEQPDFAPRDKNARYERFSLSFDQLDHEDRAASITLEKPTRVSIVEK